MLHALRGANSDQLTKAGAALNSDPLTKAGAALTQV
jgi:hypothetical protein